MAHYPTPNLSHLSSDDYRWLYEPAEDSFLFLDALEKDRTTLQKLNPSLCVEVGCGSGVITTFLASMLELKSCYYLGIDINFRATKATLETLRANKITHADVICDDLLRSTTARLNGKVDLILFNPPYVPTPSSEVGGSSIESSWAGGKDGREVIDRLLPEVSSLLSDGGLFYLLLLRENNPDDIRKDLKRQGLVSETVLARRAGQEHLSVIRFSSKFW